MKAIDSSSNDQRKKNPDAIGQKDTNRPHHIAAAVFLEIGNQGTQTFRQHRLVRCDSTSTSFSFAAAVPCEARCAARADRRMRLHPLSAAIPPNSPKRTRWNQSSRSKRFQRPFTPLEKRQLFISFQQTLRPVSRVFPVEYLYSSTISRTALSRPRDVR